MSRLILFMAAALFTVSHGLAPASAQSYPQRSVRFILPFGPGAGVDITARMLAERLATRWGKPVMIENRPGGDGIVAITVSLTHSPPPRSELQAPLAPVARPDADRDCHSYRDSAVVARITQTRVAW